MNVGQVIRMAIELKNTLISVPTPRARQEGKDLSFEEFQSFNSEWKQFCENEMNFFEEKWNKKLEDYHRGSSPSKSGGEGSEEEK